MSIPHALVLFARSQMRHKQLINTGFQICMVTLLAWVLYSEIKSRDNLIAMWQIFIQQLYQAPVGYLLLTLLLLPLNWLIEAIKWRHFMLRYESISLYRAFKAVLAGICFALITPNRIGELGGRLLFVDRANQWHSMLANVLGSIAQYLVSLLAGVLGAFYLGPQLFPQHQIWWNWAMLGALIGILVIYLIFFNSPALAPFFKSLAKAKYLHFLHPKLDLLEQLDRKDLYFTFGWSLLRYLIYSSQYYCVLCFFGINPGFTVAYAGIFLIFLLQTVLPLPALASLLARGNLAIFVWGHFGADAISALAATFLLWIINLILPALIGTLSLFSVHITKTIGYDAE